MTVFIIAAVTTGLLICIGTQKLVSHRQKRKRKESLAQAYKRLTRQHRLVVTYADTIGNRMIGLDKAGKKLIFIDHAGSKHESYVVQLNSIKSARLVNEKNNQGRIERIVLALTSNRNKPVYSLCFFDHAHDPILEQTMLANKAHHWQNRLSIQNYQGALGLEAEFVL